jgi:hypothetical protein
MRRAHTIAVVVCAAAAAFVVSSRASAQDQTPAGPPAPPPPPPPPPRPPPPPPPPREKETEEPIDHGGSDHDKIVGHLAFGYFGVSQLPIAQAAGAGNAPGEGTVNAPVIGVRYWFRPRFGIDGGLGIGVATGSQSITTTGAGTTSTSQPSQIGFAAHVGVPIALASGSHYTFELVPETLLGITTGTISTPNQSNQTLSGLRFDLGARVGAEIHFGFIGIPQLALEGSVGLYFRHQAYKWSQDSNSSSVDTNSFATSVESDPWAIFIDNISALYYF